MTFEQYYNQAINNPPFDLAINPVGFNRTKGSDESAHIPLLQLLASMCVKITELGFRNGYSTVAFAKGLGPNGLLLSIDIEQNPIVEIFNLFKMPCAWDFIKRDSSKGAPISRTDLLHIDSLHTYEQVKAELNLHGSQVNKFITAHDTYSQGIRSLDTGGRGINQALDEWTRKHNFTLIYEVFFNHGLRVYKSPTFNLK